MKEREVSIPAAGCKCSGCAGLARRYKDDPDLLAFYRRRLLQRSWAGVSDDVERAYQAAHAPWAAAAHESGVRLAQSFPRKDAATPTAERVARGGVASAPPTEDTASRPVAAGGVQGALWSVAVADGR